MTGESEISALRSLLQAHPEHYRITILPVRYTDDPDLAPGDVGETGTMHILGDGDIDYLWEYGDDINPECASLFPDQVRWWQRLITRAEVVPLVLERLDAALARIADLEDRLDDFPTPGNLEAERRWQV